MSLIVSYVEYVFMCFLTICHLWRKSVYVFCRFLHWVVCFSGVELHELVVLKINPLSVVSFAIIFSHSEGCLLMFMVSFAMQKRP